MNFFYILKWCEYKKASDNPNKIKWDRGMIKSVTQQEDG
jgi:hypothetical protein